MNIPYELQVGWRYLRAGKGGRRNAFISFISGVSMVGIALGVAALIVVLSVMNGFQREVRDAMLSAIAHLEVTRWDGQGVEDWRSVAQAAQARPEVLGAAPFVNSQALLARGEDMRGVMVRGVLPTEEPKVTPMAAKLGPEVLNQLQPGQWKILIGVELARQLGVQVGEQLVMMAPGGQVTPAGVAPRMRSFTVAGVFQAGHYEYDAGLVMMHLDDAAKLFRTGGASGVQLRLQDLHQARAIAGELQPTLGPDWRVRDWTRANPTWFTAVQIEKRMMAIILTLIVAVAAFNLVSTLVMVVTDKQSDIAILRTLGASPRSIQAIFIVQGAFAGVVGTVIGVVLGLSLAFNVGTIVQAIERLIGAKFLPANIYLVSSMPSDPQRADIIPIALISLALAFLATLYPSWRAARVQPAQALRYE
ncbi:lipoprotein-releasing system permease protein [Inhella inkyongensis]|uniref:Lipoprotein-releasing system permease protein n=1 Tax=Inhella inkyongensis TaxID=392593 RepID=A0A840S451_9BURK|nr:lipoprotein-releasing ABC transporter permease subunit [Inhella inkyongensis]MBB5204228.1 lipoprotein-releasing system permease protein [Inhella inkyongensis]